ncbi:MAG: ketoacyl-ACP synthase III [Acidimicrobiia bacterium]|nr:ketoacyl-ACP synthase III [Acidimicrobiia bacterium]
MTRAAITGWGKCVPPAVLSNHDLEQVMDTNDEWIHTRSGIKERRISHVEVSDMAAVAAEHAIAAAGLEAEDIDMLLVCTCSPDRLIPSAAAMVQAKIGAHNAGTMDLNAACTGFLYGLATAAGMIASGVIKRAVVIGAEKLTAFLNTQERATGVLFGDGAGAVVLEATESPTDGILSTELGSDGRMTELLSVTHTGTEYNDDPLYAERTVYMEGREIFRNAVVKMAESAAAALEKAGLTVADVDLLIPHQANVRIIDATAKRMNLDPAQVYVNIASYGNTSAATIPIALTEALEEGRIKPGNVIVFVAFGGGLTWGGLAMRWGDRTEAVDKSDAALPPTDKTGLELLAARPRV